ncbi:uncharacterized protein LOC125508546 isoform X1 [Triticum urartu]|uniref:uncharacterized protein LOC125508546 isoform X1 n=1 Tax=Triticum urartu TaxID=4572 RepID=UPI002043E155|nr:uncharacterized protein LOC125508546 isoform X1 [Triticum urartu]XP_048529237.1 uncharacterized protein LOC125508546 isoform X1 [Triticum urartu]
MWSPLIGRDAAGAAAGYGGGPLMELGADAEAMGPTLCVQIMMTWSTVMGSFYSSLPIFIGLGSIGSVNRLKTMYPFPVWIPTIAFNNNFLLTTNRKKLKLTDLGLTREETVTEMMTTEIGTYRYGHRGQGGGRCQWKTWLRMKVHSPIVFKKMRRSWFCVDAP